MTYFIQILTGTLGAFGFAILYNLRGTKLLIATLGGHIFIFRNMVSQRAAQVFFCGNRSYDLCRDICKN